jgi:hypothetical protein
MAGRATGYSDYYKNNSNPLNSADAIEEDDQEVPKKKMPVDPESKRKAAIRRRLLARKASN